MRGTTGFCALLFVSSMASAATVTQRPLLFTFDGTASGGPLNEPRSIAIDNATGDVYVGSDSKSGQSGFVSKFTPAGVPANFSATGTSSLLGGFTSVLGLAIDTSGGAGQGRSEILDGTGSDGAGIAQFQRAGEGVEGCRRRALHRAL